MMPVGSKHSMFILAGMIWEPHSSPDDGGIVTSSTTLQSRQQMVFLQLHFWAVFSVIITFSFNIGLVLTEALNAFNNDMCSL